MKLRNFNILFLALIIFLIILIVGIFIVQKFFQQERIKEVSEKEERLFTLGNDQVDKAVQEYLLLQKIFSWRTMDESRNFCVFEKIDSENDLFPFYLWVRCGEFIMQNNKLQELSGMSGPAKIDYPNELSFYDLDKFFHTVPRAGSLYAEDIKNIFPLNLQKQINNFNSQAINERIENIARDSF